MNSNPSSQNYDYSNSGISPFLGRSIDEVQWQTQLETSLTYPGSGTLQGMQPPANSNTFRADANQSSGAIGNILSIGNIQLDGVNGVINITDGNGNVTGAIGNVGD